MKRLFVLIATLLVASTFAFAQPSTSITAKQNNTSTVSTAVEKEILQMEKEWNDARAKTDRAALERLVANEFVTFTEEGEEVGKDRVVKNFRAPNLEAMETGNVKVKVFGDTAIATGWNLRKWLIMDRETSPQEWFTDVWMKRNGKWQIVSTQWTMKKEHPFKSNVVAELKNNDLKLITASGCEQEPSLKSLKSDTATAIKFTNPTNQPVNVYWLNYEGKRDQRGYFLFAPYPSGQPETVVLAPGKFVSRNTFLTHPFVITDAGGKCLGIYQPMKEPGLVVIK